MVQDSQAPEDTPLGNDAKRRRIPAFVMRYLPVVDRLRRMFLNPKEAALMTWWDDDRKVFTPDFGVVCENPKFLRFAMPAVSFEESAKPDRRRNQLMGHDVCIYSDLDDANKGSKDS